MSKSTDTQNVTPLATEEKTKESFVRRFVVAPIQKHPKIAIAVAAGVALVGAASIAGRNADLAVSSVEDETDWDADNSVVFNES